MGDIGTSGELHFMALCAGEGITANKSQADRHGWDVLIEVDQDAAGLTQQTLHEPIITGTVQIKSTQSTSLKVSVTLANLRKMASNSLPAFYLLMDFSQGQVPTRAFLRHVDEGLIEQILERVNTHVVTGKGGRLHKASMQIDFGQGREIALNGSTSFKAEILRTIGSSQAQYIDRKHRFLQKVGFGDGSQSMRFSLEGHENLQAMVEATLGRGGPVELREMQFVSKRFGLEDPKSHWNASVGTLVVEPSPPASRGTITLRNRRTGDSVQLDAAAYVSAMHALLPSSTLQIRIDCGLFDWYINADGTEAKFNSTLDPEIPVKLEHLCSYLQVIKMLAQPEGLAVEMDFHGSKSPFTITGGSSLPTFPGALGTADILLKTKMELGDRGLLEVSLLELIRSGQNVRAFHAFLSQKASARLEFPYEDLAEPFEAVCLAPLELSVGGKCYLVILAVYGDLSVLPNGRFSMATTHHDTVYKTVLSEHERTQEATLRQLQQVVDDFTHHLPIVSLMPPMPNLDARDQDHTV
ncbi:hypothetical protein QWI18_25020 [Pseudomonas sp. W2Oct36]|uniref:hypothetical protein n=1 Tax=Pseudomonas TaxID=286 RepID=UPI000F037804|nr:hypothetical protein [Pseudomonas viridiflava]